MKINKRKFLIIVLIILGILTPLLLFDSALALIKDDIQQGVCGAAGQPACSSGAAADSINNTISAVINILSVVVGIVAVVMIIFAGFRYITSAGNEQAVASAKKTLLFAIIGLIIVAFAQTIARVVLNTATDKTPTSPPSQPSGPGNTPPPGGTNPI